MYIYKKGQQMKDYPYNRNLIANAAHNRSGGFKIMQKNL